jgi:condensin-2 complex subunit G2
LYYKTWKNSSGKTLLSVEYNCIQNLMYHAIHSRDFSLFKSIRVILDAFHLNKKQNGVDELLLRLYEPILFRSLSVANEDVRRNAALLLIDSFPFRNPDHNKEESEILIQKQYKCLEVKKSFIKLRNC